MSEKQYTVVSLFTGAMGLDLGLERTGRFRLLACVEKEPAFCQTIRHNQQSGQLPAELQVFEADISRLDPGDLLQAIGLQPGQIDLLIGGPPCQSFSTAGRRGTVQDPRGTLLWQFLRFVSAVRPKFFLMENVRGLLSAALRHRPISDRPDKGGPPLSTEEEPGSVVRAFADDLQRIEGSPYHMDCFEVNAVNYGAPQLRERALFIGNRYNDLVDFPQPTHGQPADQSEQPSLLQDDPASSLRPWRTLGDALNGLSDPGSVLMDFSPRKKSYLALVPPGSNWRSLPLELQRESMGSAWHAKGGRSGWWRRLSFDLPCPTLVTMPNHAGTSLCHPSDVRALSLREYARIQEFPDQWQFVGTAGQQYAQVGNAVPVRLGEVAGSVIVASLDRLRLRNWRPYPRPKVPYRVVYIQSHVRTRSWFRNGKTLVWQDGSDNLTASYAAPRTIRRTRNL